MVEEDGKELDGTIAVASLTEIARERIDGEEWVARELVLAVLPPAGYHRLILDADAAKVLQCPPTL